jgi:hypothetical protein
MITWTKEAWFKDFISSVREAISDALSEIEDGANRVKTNIFLQGSGLLKQPQTFSNKEIVTELGKAMTRDRLGGLNLTVYENLYPILPAMRRFREALFSQKLYECVQIPPTPSVIVDGRVPALEFFKELNQQVFVIPVDD